MIYKFLEHSIYIDYTADIIATKAAELFNSDMSDIEKARVAYEYVRDEIPHSFDCNASVITCIASDVLKFGTGICHAKANLLAALLRSQRIPTGFRFQHITLAEDDALGYCLHCLNAIYLDGKWIQVDARGNTNGKNAQFSLDEPVLAFPNRPQYDEYLFDGIYATPDIPTMEMLMNAKNLQDVLNGLPERPSGLPDDSAGIN